MKHVLSHGKSKPYLDICADPGIYSLSFYEGPPSPQKFYPTYFTVVTNEKKNMPFQDYYQEKYCQYFQQKNYLSSNSVSFLFKLCKNFVNQ